MVPLMARIAWEIANKVAHVVNVRTILKEQPAQAKKKIVDARELLESWSKVSFRPPPYISCFSYAATKSLKCLNAFFFFFFFFFFF
jgi:hypothetical protein